MQSPFGRLRAGFRLTTPKLKIVLGPRSLRMTASLVLLISDSGH